MIENQRLGPEEGFYELINQNYMAESSFEDEVQKILGRDDRIQKNLEPEGKESNPKEQAPPVERQATSKKRKFEHLGSDIVETLDDEDDQQDSQEDEHEWEGRWIDSDYEQDDDVHLADLARSRKLEWHEVLTQLGRKEKYDSDDSNDDEDSDEGWEPGDDVSEEELLSQSSCESGEEVGDRTKLRACKRFVRPGLDEDVVFGVGHVFANRKEFQFACRHHGVMAHKRIKLHVGNKKRYTFKCRSNINCPWMVSANFRARRNSWEITSLQPKHTCTPTLNHSCCNYKYLAERYKVDIQIMPDLKTSQLQQKAHNDLGILPSRSKCIRAKEAALQEILGSYRKQYTMMRDYSNELMRSNPGSTVLLQTTKDLVGNQFFRRMYVCFDACMRGFIEGCRPVLGIDACHLKGPHKGVLMSVIGIDANDQIFPVAYAVAEIENTSSWSWFLGNLQLDVKICNSPEWTIISDKQAGIKAAITGLFPRIEHRKCTWHMYNNFKGSYSSLELKELVWAAAKCTNKNQFEVQMDRIKKNNPGAYEWLQQNTTYSEWSRAHFRTGSKCDILVNNIVECFNKVILDARDKPLLTMMEALRFYYMDRHYQKRAFIDRLKDVIGPKVRRKLEKNIRESNRCFADLPGTWNFKFLVALVMICML